uniref:Putative ecdysteroid kinase n=1 Tax=Nyssomyia neivai TaxID=330878 RepID=A0A1L8DYL8_9DIPT
MEDLVEEVPRFLNADYIDVIVKKIEKTNNVKVQKFELKPVTKKGNHYSSVMIRIVVDYVVVESKNPKHLSLILKTTYDEKHDDEESIKLLNEFDVHNREMEIYETVLDEFHKLLRSINDGTVFSAHNYWLDSTNRALILEDLMVREYKCVNRIERMDVAHAKVALIKLAKYHATSIIFKQKNPQAFAKFSKGYFSRDKPDIREFFFRHFDGLIELVSTWKGYEYYVEKLIKFKDLLVERGIELYTSHEGNFNVLTHGDFWSNNMMFRYDSENNPIDVIFVDFQIPQWNTPAIDIHYLIHTSIKEHLRFSKQNELVQMYYYALKETLIDGYKYTGYFPTLHEFQIIILKSSLHALISALLIQPIIILDEKIESNLFLLMNKDEAGKKFTHDMYHSPNTQEVVKNVLPVFDALGILD